MYTYLFGPVPSRRLGMSLGVDLVPKKVCSLDCVYCEVGKTTKLTLDRMEYIPFEKVKEELTDYFAHHPDPDYITFSGSGEPTLNSRLGDVLSFIKKTKPGLPVAVLTNGTLFADSDVRNAVMGADVILPSLDAATEKGFREINRPHPELSVENCIGGLVSLRKEFRGNILLEIFILPGYNDSREELAALKDAIGRIEPDSVQLNTLDRPGTIPDLRPASVEELQRIIDLWGLEGVEIVAAAPKRKEIRSYRSDAETAILETIARRPCTLDDLSDILGLHISEVNKYLDVLEAEEKIRRVRQERGVFYQLPEDQFFRSRSHRSR